MGEVKVQGGGEGEGAGLLAEEAGERRDQKWILAREQVEGLVNWAVSSTQVKNKQTNKQTNKQNKQKTNKHINKQTNKQSTKQSNNNLTNMYLQDKQKL